MKLAMIAVLLVACGPGRSTFARAPGGVATFDRSQSDPKALAIADRVFSTAGGSHWAAVKQLKWSETITGEGNALLDFEEAWDRWNGRHYGRLHTENGDAVVMRMLYEKSGNAYLDSGQVMHAIDEPEASKALDRARERWLFDTSTLCMAFLLEEPGTKLEYTGELPGEAGKPPLDDIKVTFDPADKNRSGTWHAIVNRDTNQIDRIEVVKAGDPDTTRIGYALSQWTEVSGMKVPTKLQNLGLASEVITFKDVVVGEPDDMLYMPVVH